MQDRSSLGKWYDSTAIEGEGQKEGNSRKEILLKGGDTFAYLRQRKTTNTGLSDHKNNNDNDEEAI